MVQAGPTIELLLHLGDLLLRLLLHEVLQFTAQPLQFCLQAFILNSQLHHNLLLLRQWLAFWIWILNLTEVPGQILRSLRRWLSQLLHASLPVMRTSEFSLYAAACWSHTHR